MSIREGYHPGPAEGAEVRKDGENWTLVLVRMLKHSPELVWKALTEPNELREWAPFDASGNLGATGATVSLSTVGTPTPQVSESTVKLAEPARALEYTWGGNDIRWELEPVGSGTRLTLWHTIPKDFVAMGAAGWHICLDVLDRFLDGTPLGRIVGGDAMKHGWKDLNAAYGEQFGIAAPKW